jgi:hypothetical protein
VSQQPDHIRGIESCFVSISDASHVKATSTVGDLLGALASYARNFEAGRFVSPRVVIILDSLHISGSKARHS